LRHGEVRLVFEAVWNRKRIDKGIEKVELRKRESDPTDISADAAGKETNI
jgi:hypothetical protein